MTAIDHYLEQLDPTEVIHARVLEIHGLASLVCPEEISAIFVSEYLTSDGQRQYTNLHLFSPRYVTEVANFASSMQIDLVPFVGRVDAIEFIPTEFDLQAPVPESRLVVKAHLDFNYMFEMSGTARNALLLLEQVRSTLVPAMRHGIQT